MGHFACIRSSNLFFVLTTTDYTVDCIVWVVSRARFDEGNESTLKTALLEDVVGNILRQSALPLTVLLARLAHMEKVLKISTGSLPLHWSCERIFLGAFLLASRVRLRQ